MAVGCPYRAQANWMCSNLVKELLKADCWADFKNIIDALVKVRMEERHHTEEWQHLHSPKPDCNTMEPKSEL